MKLTNKQIKQIIKEELSNVIKETMSSPTHDKIVTLITTDEEGLNQALVLFDSVKGTGMLQPFEEDHIQRLSDYASASYRHRSIVDEMAALKIEFDDAQRTRTKRAIRKDWRALKKERAANLRDMRELEYKINPRDKRMIAQVTGFA